LTSDSLLFRPAWRIIHRLLPLLFVTPALGLIPQTLSAQTVVGSLTHAGMKPGAVAVYEAGNKVFVGDRETGMVYIFDGATNAEIGSVATGLPSILEFVVDETRGKVWATCSCVGFLGSGYIAVLDATTGALDRTINLGGNFARFAKDETLGRVYVKAGSNFYAFDAGTYAVTTVPGVHLTLYSGLAVNPVTHEVFTSDGLTKLYIIDGQTLALTTLQPPLLKSSLWVTVNTIENKVYIASDYADNFAGDILVFNRNTNVLTPLHLGTYSLPIVYDPVTNKAFSAKGHTIDGATDAVSYAEVSASDVAVRRSTGHVYYAGGFWLGVQDAANGFLEVLAIGSGTAAINQSTGRVYATYGDHVTVIQDASRLTRPPVYVLATNASTSRTYTLDSVAKQIAVTRLTYGVYGLAVRPGSASIYEATYDRGNSGGRVDSFEGIQGDVPSQSGPAGGKPAGLAVTPDGNRIYVAKSDAAQVAVQDAATLAVVTTVPVGSTPWGLALSPDGARVYVANRGANSVSIIDTASNTVIGSVPVGSQPRAVAVNPSGTKAYVANTTAGTVSVIDTASNAVVATVSVGSQPHWLAATPDGRRIYVSNSGSGTVSVIATDTDTVVQTVAVGGTPEGVVALPDGSEVWVGTCTTGAASIVIIKTADYSTTTTIAVPRGHTTFPENMLALAVADPTGRFAGRITRASNGTPLGGVLVRALQGGLEAGTATSDAAGNYAVFSLAPGVYDLQVSAAGYVTQTFGSLTASAGRTAVRHVAAVTTAPTVALDKTALVFSAITSGAAFTAQTSAQTVRVTQSGAGTVTWTAASTTPWLVVSPTSGSGARTLTIAPQFASGLTATQTGTITLAFTGASNTAGPITVTLTVVSSTAAVSPPFGVVDTPAGDATVLAGSIAVTGWTLDNIGVQRVELWRDLQAGETTPPFASTPSDPRNGKIFIANATFVDGARPDVEALYPTTPFNYRAGWGYLLLTWGLWNQGNGTYRLYAYGFDQENTLGTIGTKTILVSNTAATKPFGSIDTPAIGGEASGPNFGWGLTPKVGGVATCKIQPSGVQVSIDSGPLQPVVYGADVRADIAGAFTGFSNSAAAGGHYIVDWSTLANGPHTIGWLITDDCNRADGVGSRFFNVTTGTNLLAGDTGGTIVSRMSLTAGVSGLSQAVETESVEPITVARGYGELPEIVRPGPGGSRTIELQQGERIELRMPRGFESAIQLGPDGQSRALPTGSNWNAASGTFYWEPAPGFLGRYRIVFTNGRERISVRVVVTP
jgi:YVTN family beta-propeller protein